jgi:hypothetical protein
LLISALCFQIIITAVKQEANRSKTRNGKQYLATLSVEQIRSNAMFSDYNHSCKAEANRSKTTNGKQYLATLSVEHQLQSNAII